MSAPSQVYDIPALALSDSSLSISCDRKLELRKLYGHARNDSDGSLATEAGHALHAAWQTYMATRDKEAGAWALIERYPAQWQSSPNNERSIEACYSTYLAMLDNPLDSRYQLATVLHNGVEMPAVEVPFRITFKDVSLFPDRNVPIHYDGFIDAILWDTLLKRFVVVDIKTTRQFRSDYTGKFGRDPQCLPYAYVLEKALGQPADSLTVLYLIAYIDALEPRVLKYEFQKSKWDIHEWAMRTAMEVNRIRQLASIGFFPRNGKACENYGRCAYDAVCDYRQPDDIREMLDMQFGPRDDSKITDFDAWFTLQLEITGMAA